MAAITLLRRGLRLAVPALGTIGMFYLLPFVTSGPGFDTFFPQIIEKCDKRWWANILFINNFWVLDKACAGNQWFV